MMNFFRRLLGRPPRYEYLTVHFEQVAEALNDMGKAIKDLEGLTSLLERIDMSGSMDLPVKILLGGGSEGPYSVHFEYRGHTLLAGEEGLETLRRMGYTVRVSHYRYWPNLVGGGWILLTPEEAGKVLPRFADFGVPNPDGSGEFHTHRIEYRYDQPHTHGGYTRVLLVAPSGHWAEGAAECSIKDMYSKKVGRDLATLRAVERLNELVGKS